MATGLRMWICAMLTCLAVAGCGVVVADAPLEDKLGELKASGQTARLSDLTDFSWDEVNIFDEYTRREAIERIVGSPVISADYHVSGKLLVFEDHGKVVKTITLNRGYLGADDYTYGYDVLVKPNGQAAMRLTSPGADDPKN